MRSLKERFRDWLLNGYKPSRYSPEDDLNWALIEKLHPAEATIEIDDNNRCVCHGIQLFPTEPKDESPVVRVD